MTRALVYGIAVAGDAVATALHHRGVDVILVDDVASPTATAAAEALGTELIVAPSSSEIADLVERCELVCPAPGVAETHDVIVAALAAGTPLRTEIDLAYEWEQERAGGPRPMLAVTGTDGKTTTTKMATAMLAAAGQRAVDAGNTDVPLVAALDGDADVFVVECSSFRLNWLARFRAEAAVWLNFAPDHQNWHASLGAYEAAKARVWANRRDGDVAIGFAADPVVMRNLARAGGETRTFGAADADYRCESGWLVGPHGVIADVATMSRSLPHDVTNALAAAALVLEAGLADADAVSAALRTFQHPSHRIEPVGELHGVRWFNDSKATTPHATLTAIRGFEQIVLLAGGRNKGLDLASLASEHERVKAVVALGESASAVAAAFAPWCPVIEVTDMGRAVEAAASLAGAGDVVLLSPACASFDWYPTGGYSERGDDFKRHVGALIAAGADTPTGAVR